MGHGPLDSCRVKTNFSARVPKNLGGPRPPLEVVPARLKRGPRAETRGVLVPRVFALMTDHESEGSGVENEACLDNGVIRNGLYIVCRYVPYYSVPKVALSGWWFKVGKLTEKKPAIKSLHFKTNKITKFLTIIISASHTALMQVHTMATDTRNFDKFPISRG